MRLGLIGAGVSEGFYWRAHRTALAATLAALGLAGLSLPPSARAWGSEGHRIIGLVADELLDGRTRLALRQIAGEASLADIGLWMDLERRSFSAEQPGSDHWHFDNRPVCAPALGLDSYCHDGNCASRAYRRYLAILGDAGQAPGTRLQALRIVVHILGDIHQPLHAADNGDRGGNAVRVQVGRRGHPRSLHAAWDSDFVKRAVRGESEAAFAHRLVSEHGADRTQLEAGGFDSWLQESYDLARSYAYGRLPDFVCGQSEQGVVQLPVEYSDGAAKIVADQLARAGVRLAAVLRATL